MSSRRQAPGPDADARDPVAEPEPFQIGDYRVAPGSRDRIELPVARLPTGTSMSLPVEIVHGRRSGPAVFLSGGIHGDELDGVEIVRQVLDDLRPDRMVGTVVGVPLVNLFGALEESRYLPDRRDLNRSFPGSPRGSLASQLAHLLMREVVGRCDVGIDYHCGTDDRENLPQVRCDLDDEETRRLARAFGAPVTIDGSAPDGSLRRAGVRAGARVLLYEGGEARRFSPAAIRTGVGGTRRVLAALGMIRRSEGDETPETVEVRATQWVRAGRSGICRVEAELGARVRKGDRVAIIRDVLGGEARPVKARSGGIVVGRRINPLVYRGEAIAHVALVP